jgi:hypothetical protein
MTRQTQMEREALAERTAREAQMEREAVAERPHR